MGSAATEKKEPKLIDKFVTWLNGYELEEEEYVDALHSIVSECNARLEEEKPDETSRS